MFTTHRDQRVAKDHGDQKIKKSLLNEVGCGPGFFTIPAAEIVGGGGSIYAVDVHPAAIARVKKRVESGGI